MTNPETINTMRKTLKEMAAHRLEIKKMLGMATNPDLRTELEAGLVRCMDHEEKMRDLLNECEFNLKMRPLLKEAAEALDTGDHTTVDQAIKWHAARGNQFALDYLKHVNGFEYQQRNNEIDAAMNWHPGWHENEDRSWNCDDPKVWEIDQLLAQYRRPRSTSKSAPWT